MLKRSLIKWKSLRLLSAQVKICQILYVNLETTNQFFSKFCITLQFHERTPLCFFSSNNTYFAQKEPIKVKILETFKCSVQNLLNSLCQFWNDKLIPLQILYHSSVSWKITHLYFFSSGNIYFAQKGPIKVNILKLLKSWVSFV